ncbi:MAG TPA: hypothetical protein ENN55_05350 [Firmicutes bacterium]|nr:hypothetical protein [Bacillota bacterium]
MFDKKRVTVLIFIVFFIVSGYVSAFDPEDERDPYLYSPNNMKSLWKYKGSRKSSPDKKFNFEAYISDRYISGGITNYVYYTPVESTRNVIFADETGCYISFIRYPVPVLNFLFFTVELNPPIPMMLYPLEVGKKWEVEFTGTIDVDVLKLFKIERKGKVRSEITAMEIMEINGREVKTYKVKSLIDEGNGVFNENYFWFGKGMGYVKGDTPHYFVELLDYKVREQRKPGER